jgi:hypothetical protein
MRLAAETVVDSDAAEAEASARASIKALLDACDRNHSWDRVAETADAAYLSIGRLAALARAASSR